MRRRSESERNPDAEEQLVASSGLFDEGWYVCNNPEALRCPGGPLRHYMRKGPPRCAIQTLTSIRLGTADRFPTSIRPDRTLSFTILSAD